MTTKISAADGLILDLHRLSTDDGPGLRDTVFLKGCHLRCVWCHNPESLSFRPEVWWLERKCIGARDCLRVCQEAALTLTPSGMVIDRQRCTSCGDCVQACPSRAFELLGETWTVERTVREVMKDQIFFRNSGGGVTASGGEPCAQSEFVAAFLEACQGQGLHTAVDTCGFPAWEDFERVVRHSDLVLFDLKEMNPENHLRHTGVTNERILENLMALRDYRNARGVPPVIWIRTPVIPGYTATEETISDIGRFLAQQMGDRVARWDLCAFNNTCGAKYERLGRSWPLSEKALLDREQAGSLLKLAQSAWGRNEAVQLTGLI